jgi:hypothetical protein
MIRWIILLVIVIIGLVGVFYFIGNDYVTEEEVVKFFIDDRCAVCGNGCVTLEFAKRAGCLAPTEDFGCKFDDDECYRVDEKPDCKLTKDINYVCGVDGKTYTNPSYAKCDGVVIDYYGECTSELGYTVDGTGITIIGDDPVCGDGECEPIEGDSCPGPDLPNAGCFQNPYFCLRDCSEKTDTSGDYCAKDSECWCGNFNGAEFIEGKSESICCTSEDKSSECNSDNLNRCVTCYYD